MTPSKNTDLKYLMLGQITTELFSLRHLITFGLKNINPNTIFCNETYSQSAEITPLPAQRAIAPL